MLTRPANGEGSRLKSKSRSTPEPPEIGGVSKMAIVTGGSRGLGAELVSGFLERGYGVATFSRARSEFIGSIERRRRRQGDFYWSAVDSADFEALRGFVDEVAARFSRIDVLINNAARGVEGVLPTMRPDDIVEAVDVNLTAALVLCQACSRVMLRQGEGCVVNISSVNAIRGIAGVAVYSAAKAGLDGLTRSLARELGPRKIRVNSVAPGYFESDMVKGFTQERKQRVERRTPLGRLANVRDVADAIYFLASDQASFITGQTLVVDGGLTC
jgi:3-oxoacyl-[acyl-carrier protein] reductase